LDSEPRPAGDRRLPHHHRAAVRDHQSRGRHPLLGPGSACAHRGEIRMSVTDADIVPALVARPPAQTPFQRFVADFAESRLATIAFILLIVTMVLALIAPWIVPQNPYDRAQVDIMDSRLKPGTPAASGKYTHWLGTD